MRLLPDTLPMTTPTASTPDPAEAALYRQALGSFGTGVTVVTTRWDDQDWGMTCNSFSSVSLDPRLVLWCIRREASSIEAFTRSDGFTVNVLSLAQQALARQFATGSLEQRFADVAVHRQPSERLRLADTAAWFDCALHQVVEAGDHHIVIGRVLRFACQDTPALSYWRSRFGGFGVQPA